MHKNAGDSQIKRSPGVNRNIREPQAVYNWNSTTQKANVVFYKPGETVRWLKGDLVIKNPKRIVAGNTLTNKTRAAMFDAFARAEYGVTTNELLRIEGLYQEYDKAIRELTTGNKKIIDLNAPKTQERMGILGEAELAVLGEYFDRASLINMNKKML